ncbi:MULTISPECIES: CaiB/BaiF CoA-transferase family protein [unclassified Frankia]|uniref:CaiB/BaiF CoA transferase family protein n=1 Tax=unclassified Frankia TaxID=2632575 RepID=UPI002AD2E67A|nr:MULTISPECIES: CaiB/BaiF CoA-transferase family protein [unclassified Frankia]
MVEKQVTTSGGPLRGVRVVELAGQGPGPFAAMLLADMGADVLSVDRSPETRVELAPALLARGRRTVTVDLKDPAGVAAVLALTDAADAFIEGYRPGVAERLGVGPDVCLARNPGLVYGRMTGWGQDGPYARSAGHDINYIALAGALDPIGREGQAPVPPLNLVGDFGGGGMLLAFGVMCALFEAKASGLGQVVDAAMVDGAALLMMMTHEMRAAGQWDGPRGTNVLDTGAPFYNVYETADGRYVAVGAIENNFYRTLLELVGLDPVDPATQWDKAGWRPMKARLAEVFRTRTRDEWCALLEHTDACFAPVLSMDEAPSHPHIAYRETFTDSGGAVRPAPAPRFSRTPASTPPGPVEASLDEALAAWGVAVGPSAGPVRRAGLG